MINLLHGIERRGFGSTPMPGVDGRIYCG